MAEPDADLDRILADDPAAVARSAAAAAEPPAFEALARRGRRRRTRRQAVYLGAVAVTVAGILGTVQLLDAGDGRPSPAPAPTVPTASTTPADRGATTPSDPARIVDADDAILNAMAVTPGRPDERATVWSGPGGDSWAIAVTDDGFATRRLLDVPMGSSVEPLGDGRFVVRRAWEGRRLDIVDAGGGLAPVAIANVPAPVGSGEVPVVLHDGAESTVVAVGPDGAGHPVPTPAGLADLVAFGGRLAGTAGNDGVITYHWSDDGGASWRQAEIEGEGTDDFLPAVATAAAGEPHAVVEGGDGATIFPILAVDSAPANGSAWTLDPVERSESRWPTLNGSWIARDGRLRVLASYYDEKGRQPVDAGVFVVEDGRLTKTTSDHPEISDIQQWTLIETYDDGPVLWLPGAPGEVWRSADDGATWERYPAR